MNLCVEIGGDESHFNISLIVRDRVTKTNVHRSQCLKRERRAKAELNGGPSAQQPNALLQGQIHVFHLKRLSFYTYSVQLTWKKRRRKKVCHGQYYPVWLAG